MKYIVRINAAVFGIIYQISFYHCNALRFCTFSFFFLKFMFYFPNKLQHFKIFFSSRHPTFTCFYFLCHTTWILPVVTTFCLTKKKYKMPISTNYQYPNPRWDCPDKMINTCNFKFRFPPKQILTSNLMWPMGSNEPKCY